MGSIPTPHMLATCEWVHPVQLHNVICLTKQQRKFIMSDGQKERLRLVIQQLIANKSLNAEEKSIRIMLAMEMVERGVA